MTVPFSPTPGVADGGEVTRLLRLARDGDPDALHRVVPLVYDDLRRIARRQLRREGSGHTLDATALVHESYLRLTGGLPVPATDRAHFLAIASRSMRQVLIDHARRLSTRKRGAGWQATTLTGSLPASALAPDELLALDAALDGLEPRQRQVVECRFFGGMEETEIALALGVSERTVRRDWVKARAWLYSALYPEDAGPPAAPAPHA
jgi:RNA polymerase sigma factor (TIGR02999 family)